MLRVGTRVRPAFRGTTVGHGQRWRRGATSASVWGIRVSLYRAKTCVLRQHVALLRVDTEGRRIDPREPEDEQIQRTPKRRLHPGRPWYRHVCVRLGAGLAERAPSTGCCCIHTPWGSQTGRASPSPTHSDNGSPHAPPPPPPHSTHTSVFY